MLERAAALLGLRPTRLVPEPVAAALHADETGLLAVPDGASVAVVDLGAGSVDTARTPASRSSSRARRYCLVPVPAGRHP
ncbi:hypothetical protein [Dactylosporangium sp. NPDC048998]|uniref:hypothetical protein n=1 Tax=Dactylosporangium sp. NPDC048998 TaxID=3363976 RepID=UPI003718EB0A